MVNSPRLPKNTSPFWRNKVIKCALPEISIEFWQMALSIFPSTEVESWPKETAKDTGGFLEVPMSTFFIQTIVTPRRCGPAVLSRSVDTSYCRAVPNSSDYGPDVH
jgi:hypothetical protein